MKKKTFSILFVILICLLFFNCTETVIVQDIRGSKLDELNIEGEKDSVLIIDSRTNSEYKVKHIKNAINIPKDEIKYRLNEINDKKDKTIIVYAKTNDESFKAAKILAHYGFTKILNAEGIEQYTYDLIMYNSIRGPKFEKMMTEKNTIIVDCRSTRAFYISHIEGAISIPFMNLEENLDKLPKHKTILLYDSVGTAASRAAKELSMLGYIDIYASIDGVNNYPFKMVTDN